MTDIPAEAAQLAEQTAQLAAIPANLKITDAVTYESAGEYLKKLSAREKDIEEMRKKLKAPILAAGKAIDAFFAAPLERITAARTVYKKAILSYQLEEERKRREAEAKAQEIARKERERLEAQAAKAAEKGKEEKAAALQVAASSVVVPVIPSTTAKLAGISTRTTWSAQVVDLMELVKAVAAGTVPLNALQANTVFLNNQARAMKDTLTYPGVKATSQTGLAA